MILEVSENGELFIPLSWRRQLGIKPGDTLSVAVKDRSIVLSPKRQTKSEPQIVAEQDAKLLAG